jgi:hypothetical protein
MLMPGEYVVRTDGSNLQDAMKHYGVPGMANGGLVVNPALPSAATINSLVDSGFSAFVGGLDFSGMASAANAAALASAPGSGAPSGGNAANAAIVAAMATRVFGWGSQLAQLNYVMMRESGYNNTAQNPTSTAYGMFQFLDSTWAAYGPKTSDPYLQGLYGLEYIKSRYGSPAAAAAHEAAFNWYDQGGMLKPGSVGANSGSQPERVLSGSQTEWFEAGRAASGAGGTSSDVVAAIDRLLSAILGLPKTYQLNARQYA